MIKNKTVLITGGAGFIGSALIRHLISTTDYRVINLDKLTYAGNLDSLQTIATSLNYLFIQGDINDRELVDSILQKYKPQKLMNLAAETHVDRSIEGPAEFLKTNIFGTFALLECCLSYWKAIGEPSDFRFHHISTDEVYGSLGKEGRFSEETRYDPSSPYSASKASSDHLVRAWHRTYGLPVLITNCSNNYGPYHHPEKLIPLMIHNCLSGQKLPVYGDGKQIRDWLYVDDHVRALQLVLEKGRAGETYNIGGDSEKENIEVIKLICSYIDKLLPNSAHFPHTQLIDFVIDRRGHDRRYAIDCSKIKNELGWKQQETFESGLSKTVKWSIEHRSWTEKVMQKNESKIQRAEKK